MVILPPSELISLGGRSKDLAVFNLHGGAPAVVRDFPGEGVLALSVMSLGGRSSDLAAFNLLAGVPTSAVNLGFPGASSHWKGMETKVWIGGVNKPGGSGGGLVGSEYKQSVGVEFGSESVFEIIFFLLLARSFYTQ